MNTLYSEFVFLGSIRKKYECSIESQGLGVRNGDGNSQSILKK